MNSSLFRWTVVDKTRLLLAVMEELAGNAHISFEGNLDNLRLKNIPGASEEETTILKRNTIWPKLDFVVLPLEPAMCEEILSSLGGTLPKKVIHVQIEKSNVLEFGACDNFDPDCIFFGKALSRAFLDLLISQGVLKPAIRGHK